MTADLSPDVTLISRAPRTLLLVLLITQPLHCPRLRSQMVNSRRRYPSVGEPGVVAGVPRSDLGGGDPSDCGGGSVTGSRGRLLSCLACFLPPLPFLAHHHRSRCTVAKTFSTVVVLAPVHKSTQATQAIVHDPCPRARTPTNTDNRPNSNKSFRRVRI